MQEKEYIEIGKINIKLFKEIGYNLITDEVVFTYERLIHVKNRRIELFEEIKEILPEAIFCPDYIFKDWNNRDNTLILIKVLDEKSKLSVILKVAIQNDEKHPKNSIITIIKIGKKTFNKIVRNKERNLLKKLDNKE